jgi:broad-specificity NMP kinase
LEKDEKVKSNIIDFDEEAKLMEARKKIRIEWEILEFLTSITELLFILATNEYFYMQIKKKTSI